MKSTSEIYSLLMESPITEIIINYTMLDDEVVGNLIKWVEALRSGNFIQGRGRLCVGDRYCCLGVANEVCNLQEGSDIALHTTNALMGLRNQSGNFETPILDEYTSLIGLNDDFELTFPQIANFIVKNVLQALEEGYDATGGEEKFRTWAKVFQPMLEEVV